MSSPPEGKLETKAGHPPAVKAGGMRIVQKHPHSGDTKEEKEKDEQEWESPSPPKPTVFISGVIARVRASACDLLVPSVFRKPHSPSPGPGALCRLVSMERAVRDVGTGHAACGVSRLPPVLPHPCPSLETHPGFRKLPTGQVFLGDL
uniref:Death associated protein n=1 Tax=Rhinolophus ferrumequinum TaxID=59479 RepID=A0A671DVS7_RHIFE